MIPFSVHVVLFTNATVPPLGLSLDVAAETCIRNRALWTGPVSADKSKRMKVCRTGEASAINWALVP